MYQFVFSGGVAKIIDDEGNVLVNQPFKPVTGGQTPWTSAEEAEEYMQGLYPQYFVEEPVPTVPLPDENEAPVAEEPAQDTPPA